MNNFHILVYDEAFVDPKHMGALIIKLNEKFPNDIFYSISHLNHDESPVYLISCELKENK
jgi:hypothetical protein